MFGCSNDYDGDFLLDCCDSDIDRSCRKKYINKITRLAKDLVKTGEDISREYGIPIINKRISVTPISMLWQQVEEIR